MRAPLIRVLVVDDSAFARKVIRDVLSRAPDIDIVGIARDGIEALEKIHELHPDVMTLDLMMPDLDGLGVLKALPPEGPPRVLVVSVSSRESDVAIEALQKGAVDIITKPTSLPTDRLYDMSDQLVAKVRAAASATPRPARPPLALLSERFSFPETPAIRLVAIGTSTGGPQALTDLFRALPGGLPVPIVIGLHIPAGYTASLAERLSRIGRIKVKEARDGMELERGEAVIAQGGKHLRIQRHGDRLVASVSREPRDSLHFPSVDLLFESAAAAAGSGTLAVIMTGMGDDGLRGAGAVRAAGGRVFAESASSCVVYGMPRCVIEAGLADEQAPLEGLPARIVHALERRARDGSIFVPGKASPD